MTGADLEQLAAVCQQRHVDLGIEWIHELHAELGTLALAFGLDVTQHAMMTLDAEQPVPSTDHAGIRIVDAEEPALLQARAVMDVSFRAGGTATGRAGPADREFAARALAPELVAHLRDRARRKLTITAVADTRDGVVAAGSYQPIGDTAEVLAVATLPAARRKGLAAAVTAKLAHDARANGVRVLVLSAQNDDVARVYERVGFHRIGTVCAAERPGA